jgi:hypothetical protein
VMGWCPPCRLFRPLAPNFGAELTVNDMRSGRLSHCQGWMQLPLQTLPCSWRTVLTEMAGGTPTMTRRR